MQLRYPDNLEIFCKSISSLLKGTIQATNESSAFLPIPQLGQAVPEDLGEIYCYRRGRAAGSSLMSMPKT